MIAECQLESIQRIHALRAELDNSLVSIDSPIDSERQQQSRQLRIVFRSSESTHIQYSGPIIEEEQTQQNLRQSSRFTVSPTPPNILPSFANSIENRRQALHVLIAKPIYEEKDRNKIKETPNSIVVPPPTSQSVVSASSPASSIDSGVASPGSCADEFLLFGNNSPFSQHYKHRNSLPNPSTTSWESQTLPKARSRVFNFTTTSNKVDGFSSLIEALSLLPNAYKRRNEEVEEINGSNGNFKPFELQNPPLRKSHNQLERSSTTSLLLQKYNSGIEEKRKEGSLDNLNNGCLHPRSATMPPLKSILKKKSTYGASTPSIPTISSSIVYSTQRKGMFSRFVPFRSISEDHTHNDERSQRSPSLFKNNMSSVNKNDVPFSPDDSSISTSSNETIEEETDNGIADCFYCSSDNNNIIKNGERQQVQQQKKLQKRVSFSEQVQARVYRSTSSILGQRKKNEKKARSRATRRCNSDETDTTTTNNLDGTSVGLERSHLLGIYNPQGNQSSCNNGNIICKTMAASSVSNASGAGGGMSVLAQ